MEPLADTLAHDVFIAAKPRQNPDQKRAAIRTLRARSDGRADQSGSGYRCPAAPPSPALSLENPDRQRRRLYPRRIYRPDAPEAAVGDWPSCKMGDARALDGSSINLMKTVPLRQPRKQGHRQEHYASLLEVGVMRQEPSAYALLV